MSISITDVINGNTSLFYNTHVLSDEQLKGSLIRQLSALGALVDPDFVAQITQGVEISFERAYCYELCIKCDLHLVESYKATKRVEYVASMTTKTDALGNVELIPNKKVEKTHDSGTRDYNFTDRIKGVRCIIYPDSTMNSYNALDVNEIEAWADKAISSRHDGFSSNAPSEYKGLPRMEAFGEEMTKAITSYNSMKPEESEARSDTGSAISSAPNWSVDSIDFSSASITKCHSSVACVSVVAHIACVSFGEITYKLVLDEAGNMILEKSLFPMPSRLVHGKMPSDAQIHSLFVSRLQQEEDKIDPDFLSYASDINNVKIELVPRVTVLSRTGITLQASCINEPTLTRPAGFFFSSATSTQGNPYKFNSDEETAELLEAIKCADYGFSDDSRLAPPSCDVPNLSRGLKLKAKDSNFDNDRAELSKKFTHDESYITYSIVKKEGTSITHVFSPSSCCVTVTYKGESYQSVVDFTKDTPEWNICYKQSPKIIGEKVAVLEKWTSNGTKITASGILYLILSFALMALAIWQSVSFWWLDRYDFINTGTQRVIIHIFTWIRILFMFFLGIGCFVELSEARESAALCEKHKKEPLCSKVDIARLDYLIKSYGGKDTFSASDTVRSLLIATVLTTVAFLIPFIIFIF